MGYLGTWVLPKTGMARLGNGEGHRTAHGGERDQASAVLAVQNGQRREQQGTAARVGVQEVTGGPRAGGGAAGM